MRDITIAGKGSGRIILTLSMLLIVAQSFAQKFERRKPVKLGGALEMVSPGNVHGGMYSPLLSINKGKHSIFASGYFQRRSSEFVGGRFGYSINLTDGCSRNNLWDDEEEDSLSSYIVEPVKTYKPVFHLNAFLSAQYYQHALLSKSAAMIESRTAKDKSFTDWSSYRMSTVEVAAGVELNFRISKRITWKNTVGVAVYNHLDYRVSMNISKVAPTLMLGTGIHICPLN